MAVNYYGHQVARRLGWVAPAYHKNEGATLHAGACKHSLQHDGRPNGRLGVRVGLCNLGNLSRKGWKMRDELRKRMIDLCCLQ